MAKYSIKQIESLTGIKAHTFRVWEQRYGILIPHRTDTNIRYYDDDHLKMALNISLLNRNGFKISKLANLSNQQFKEALSEIQVEDSSESLFIDKLIVSMIELNESKFSSVLSKAISKYGLELVFKDVVHPFLVKAGFLWSSGGIYPSQEHFASNIIYRKILQEISKLKTEVNKESKFLLFLPEGEHHEIGLLLADYMLKSRGFKTVYLGRSVPIESYEVALKLSSANYAMCFFISGLESINIEEYIKQLSKVSPKCNIVVTGVKEKLENISLPENVTYSPSIDSTISLLESLD